MNSSLFEEKGIIPLCKTYSVIETNFLKSVWVLLMFLEGLKKPEYLPKNGS